MCRPSDRDGVPVGWGGVDVQEQAGGRQEPPGTETQGEAHKLCVMCFINTTQHIHLVTQALAQGLTSTTRLLVLL